MTNKSNRPRAALKTTAVAALRAAIAKFREQREIDDLGQSELERLARDIGLSPAELRASAGRNGDWVRLLEQRLDQFDFDKTSLESVYSKVVRDLEQTCARCGSASRCSKDFSKSESKDAISDYCPNTHTLQALETERERKNQDL